MDKDKRFLIGNAHIDPVWLWKLPEGLAEIKATFRSALDRMKEFDGYIFTCACASYYQWVERSAPSMFEEIRGRIREGRWVIAGGMWVQPDCNLPSGEAFARHLLYSQRYFKEKFGITALFGYNVDSFGHNGMLPQLFRKSGIESYVMMRPDRREKPDLPDTAFNWESPDGSSVTVYRIPFAYCDGGSNFPEMERYNELAGEQGLPLMVFYGIGNHGGGPSVRALEAAEKLIGSDIFYSSPDKYFEYLKANGIPLRTVHGDLQHHASGCYAANSRIKQLNRRSENALVAAESYNVLSGRLTGCAPMQREIANAWERVMLNQFHDILAGCSIRDAYDDAESAFGYAIETANEVRNFSIQNISWDIDTRRGLSNAPVQKNGWTLWERSGEGAPVVVFNPHSFPVKRIVRINVSEAAGICDANGIPQPVQLVRGPQTNGDSLENAAFIADIPALGYNTYYIYKDERFDFEAPNAPKAEGCVLENQYLRAEFDPETGCIARLTDKHDGRTVNSAPFARPIVIDDTEPDTWAHNIFTFDNQIGEFGGATVTVTENGPVRASIRVVSRYGDSELRQDFSLCADSVSINVNCLLRFNEHLKLVKLAFPISGEDGASAIYSMPYGFLEKPANGEEEPAQRWAAVRAGECGAAISSDCKHSFCVKDGELRMNIARGCIFADHYGHRDTMVEYQDQGDQRFSYSITPFAHFCAADIVREAALVNYEPDVVQETHHAGLLPTACSGISISSPSVQLGALKYAEDGGGIVARFYETNGEAATADISLLGRSFTLSFAPQEIKTVLLPDSGGMREILITELD